jgi:hypothetical protein
MSYISNFRYKKAFRYEKDYHSVPDFYQQRIEMSAWCNEQFGEFGTSWIFYRSVWRFRYKKDFSYFMLRWA